MKYQMKLFEKLHGASMIIGALSILLPILFWNKIPDTIPMHYNGAGEVDHWADKSSLILVFFLIGILMGIMAIVVYVVKSNLKSVHSSDIEKSQYAIVYPMIVLMNLVMQGMFAYIVFCTVCARNLGVAFLPIVLVLIAVPLGVMIWKTVTVSHKEGAGKQYREQEKKKAEAVYRSKIDWWLALLLIGTEVYFVYLIVNPILRGEEVPLMLLFTAIGISALILPLFFMKYELYEEHLLISASIYGKQRVKYQDIVNMKKTMNPLSSAAMSLQRIEIAYVECGVHKIAIISPKNRDAFIEKIEEKKCMKE